MTGRGCRRWRRRRRNVGRGRRGAGAGGCRRWRERRRNVGRRHSHGRACAPAPPLSPCRRFGGRGRPRSRLAASAGAGGAQAREGADGGGGIGGASAGAIHMVGRALLRRRCRHADASAGEGARGPDWRRRQGRAGRGCPRQARGGADGGADAGGASAGGLESGARASPPAEASPRPSGVHAVDRRAYPPILVSVSFSIDILRVSSLFLSSNDTNGYESFIIFKNNSCSFASFDDECSCFILRRLVIRKD